ncbi:hypothetical protein ACQBAU_14170 [Propionibacteriaceae bacterium Y2011]
MRFDHTDRRARFTAFLAGGAAVLCLLSIALSVAGVSSPMSPLLAVPAAVVLGALAVVSALTMNVGVSINESGVTRSVPLLGWQLRWDEITAMAIVQLGEEQELRVWAGTDPRPKLVMINAEQAAWLREHQPAPLARKNGPDELR